MDRVQTAALQHVVEIAEGHEVDSRSVGAGVALELLGELVVIVGELPAIGVVNDEELARAEQLVREDQRSESVRAGSAAGVSDDVCVTLFEAHDKLGGTMLLGVPGYRLPDEALQRVCELTEITPAQIAGTSSFYAQFRRSPVGKHVVRVCHGTACHVSGARQITDELRRHLQIPDGEDTDRDRMFTIDEVACFGCCSLAPVMMVDEHTAGNLTPTTACDALDVVEEKEPA